MAPGKGDGGKNFFSFCFFLSFNPCLVQELIVMITGLNGFFDETITGLFSLN